TTHAETGLADDAEALHSYLEESLRNRADYRAAYRRIQEARLGLQAAKNLLLPQFDFNIKAGYIGLAEGRQFSHFFSSSFTDVRGMNASIGFTYSFQHKNNEAQGRVLQAEATLKQAELRKLEIERNTSATLSTVVQAVHNASLRVKQAKESVQAFQSALSGEQEKYRLGNGSVVNILSVEDRLTNALFNQVQAELTYALSLTQLRLASGTLVPADQGIQSVDPGLFLKPPFPQVPSSDN